MDYQARGDDVAQPWAPAHSGDYVAVQAPSLGTRVSSLVKYEAALLALAEARSVDEVKPWLDKAAAMQAYGRMAKDKTLEVGASEIRIRAERRLGELIADQKTTVGLNRGKLKHGSVLVGDEDGKSVAKLADVGISYDLSSRAQKLAAVPTATFERELKEHRDRVSAEGVRVTARLARAGGVALGKPDKQTNIEKLHAENTWLRERIAELEDSTQEACGVAADLTAIASGEEAERMVVLRRELSSTKAALDACMIKGSELTKQCKVLQRKLDKAGPV